MNFKEVQLINDGIEIKSVHSDYFRPYGRVISNYDFDDVINYMLKSTAIPSDGNLYVASDEIMEKLSVKDIIQREFYGEMEIQIGYCNGKNSTLNGLEYHKGSEINVAASDFILLLGKIQDIQNNSYESNKVEAFYVPRGTAIEVYGTTLHFAPCKTQEDGFKCVVILPKGTNLPLESKVANYQEKEGELLFMKNKWLLVHSSRAALIERGAHVGIIGHNIEIKYLK